MFNWWNQLAVNVNSDLQNTHEMKQAKPNYIVLIDDSEAMGLVFDLDKLGIHLLGLFS